MSRAAAAPIYPPGRPRPSRVDTPRVVSSDGVVLHPLDARGRPISLARVSCPQDGVPSTDCGGLLHPVRFAGWLIAMNLLKRIAQQAQKLRAQKVRVSVDPGMTTAEYAVGTVAAVAFAVVLYKIVRSDAVAATLSSIITTALHAL